MYKIFFSLFFLCCSCHAQTCSWFPQPEACKPYPLVPENYELIDLGEIAIPPECLDRFALPQSYAPRINNDGVIAYNTETESIIRQNGVGEISPAKSFGSAHCFGINDRGDLLLSFDASSQNVRWTVWKTESLRKTGELSISGEGLPGSNLYLRALNNQGIAVGALRPCGKLRPAFWSASKGLHHLGYFFGWDLEGVAWDVNDNGTVVGTVFPPNCDPQVFYPFVWNEKWGLERMTDYLSLIKTQFQRSVKDLPIRFCNPLIDQNDNVYGQVFIEDKVYHYMWYPRSHEIRLKDLGNLKLNDVNKNYIFAGSLDDQAAIYQRHLQPILLTSIMDNLPDGWELLEVSAINDAGVLIGFGKLKGVYHLFQAIPALAKPKTLPPPEPKIEPPPQEPLLKFIFEGSPSDSKGGK